VPLVALMKKPYLLFSNKRVPLAGILVFQLGLESELVGNWNKQMDGDKYTSNGIIH